jgi:hypothetical protein
MCAVVELLKWNLIRVMKQDVRRVLKIAGTGSRGPSSDKEPVAILCQK